MHRVVKDFRAREKYHNGFPRLMSDIEEIVLHGTAGGQNAQAIINWLLDPKSKVKEEKLYRNIGFFHFLIDYNGEIYMIMPMDFWTYHSQSGRHDSKTVGIELMNSSKENSMEYTALQNKSLIDLIDEIILPRCKRVKRIVSHNYNAMRFSKIKKNINCPGSFFDWTILEKYKKMDIEVKEWIF